MKILALLIPLLIATTVESRAQNAPNVEHYTVTEMRDAVASASEAENGLAVKVLGDRGRYNYLLVRRDKSGEVEIHAAWDDVMVIQEGSAVLRHGGQVSGGRETGPGETRGGEITGGLVQRVSAGDVLVVAAGVPHQMEVEEGQSVTYLVVKVPGASSPGTP